MIRSGLGLLLLLLVLGGCAKPPVPDPDYETLRERVRLAEEQLATSRAEVASLRKSLDTLEERVAEAERPEPALADPPAVEPAPPVSAPIPEGEQDRKATASRMKEAPRDGRQDYQRALALLLQNMDGPGARKGFQSFLRTYPGHALEPNAVYWLAETYYMEERYPESILTFKEVVDRFPAHAKAADALLKIVYAYQRLGDHENAGFYRRILLAEHPGSEAARKAGTPSGGARE